MPDERGAKGTVVYQMKSYADGNGLTWVLVQQAVR